MSRSRPAPGRPRTLLAAALAGGALLATAAVGAPAQAAFTTGKCQGQSITGRGASFANSAHTQVWIPTAFPGYCADVGPAPGVTYESLGSGAGRRAMGERTGSNSTGSQSRNQVPRFAGTDEAPTTARQAEMNLGTDTVGDEGQVRVIPVAQGAVAVVVNIPDVTPGGAPCTISENADGSALSAAQQLKVSDAGNADRRRLQLTRDELELIFNGGTEYDTWGELVPWINDGNDTTPDAGDTRCQSFPLVRIRRLDDSGTSFAFKDYLNEVNPARGWRTTYISPDTRTWPNAERTTSFDYDNDSTVDGTETVPKCAAQVPQFTTGRLTCAENDVPLLQTTEVLPDAGNGNDDLVNKVNDYDGSIGYGDLSTARQQKARAFERQTGNDDRYWVKIQHKGSTSQYDDPQSAPLGFLDAGARGANCVNAQLRNVPSGTDPTLGNWFEVTATDSALGYGICTPTYIMAWDDYQPPYSIQGEGAAAEEAKARTVRDYLDAILSSVGQSGLGSFDYSPLGDSVRALAASAAGQIGWEKSAGTGGGGGTTTPPASTSAPASTPTPAPAVTPPSNQFTVPSARASKGNIVLSIQVPGRGTLVARGSARSRGRTVVFGTGASSIQSAGVVRLTLRQSAAFKRALRKAKGKRLKVTIRITFTPAGGQAATRTVTVTVKAPATRTR